MRHHSFPKQKSNDCDSIQVPIGFPQGVVVTYIFFSKSKHQSPRHFSSPVSQKVTSLFLKANYMPPYCHRHDEVHPCMGFLEDGNHIHRWGIFGLKWDTEGVTNTIRLAHTLEKTCGTHSHTVSANGKLGPSNPSNSICLD
ncbi:hypothetical protein VNO77_24534 [Canavalia gladiata]|uniref:Uncharacterized protein n=1 Tax=Canavalia gladiata TaxID=3824 RepID=A0AAN9L6Z8_CANGL